MTLEELTLKMRVQIGIDQIHSQILGEHTRLLRWLVQMVGGETYPPAGGRL